MQRSITLFPNGLHSENSSNALPICDIAMLMPSFPINQSAPTNRTDFYLWLQLKYSHALVLQLVRANVYKWTHSLHVTRIRSNWHLSIHLITCWEPSKLAEVVRYFSSTVGRGSLSRHLLLPALFRTVSGYLLCLTTSTAVTPRLFLSQCFGSWINKDQRVFP